MIKFEKARRVIEAGLVLNLAGFAVHASADSLELTKSKCVIVSPSDEQPISSDGVLIGPQPNANEQDYLIIDQPTLDDAKIYQKELRADADQATRTINFNKVTDHHSITVSFHDANPHITMEFEAKHNPDYSSTNAAEAIVIPMVCSTDK